MTHLQTNQVIHSNKVGIIYVFLCDHDVIVPNKRGICQVCGDSMMLADD